MFTIFQFVAIVQLIRTRTREGLIWFIRNMDDPEYSPLKDLIEGSFLVHSKRFLITITLLGWFIFVAVWLPTELVRGLNLVDLPFFPKDSPVVQMNFTSGKFDLENEEEQIKKLLKQQEQKMQSIDSRIADLKNEISEWILDVKPGEIQYASQIKNYCPQQNYFTKLDDTLHGTCPDDDFLLLPLSRIVHSMNQGSPEFPAEGVDLIAAAKMAGHIFNTKEKDQRKNQGSNQEDQDTPEFIKKNRKKEEEIIPVAASIFMQIVKNILTWNILNPAISLGGAQLKQLFQWLLLWWCIIVGRTLGLESYLRGIDKAKEDETGEIFQPVSRHSKKPENRNRNRNQNREDQNAFEDPNNLDNFDQRLHGRDRAPGGGQEFILKPYRKKPNFELRIFGFLILAVITTIICFACIFFGPLIIGRLGIQRAARLYKSYTGHSWTQAGLYLTDRDAMVPWMFGVCLLKVPYTVFSGVRDLVKEIKVGFLGYGSNYYFFGHMAIYGIFDRREFQDIF